MAGSSAASDDAPSDASDSVDERPERRDVESSLEARTAALLRDAEAAAAAQGRAMVNEARAVRKRMLDDIERRRATLLAELERVRAALDDLAHDLAAPVPASEPDQPARPTAAAAPREPRGEESRPDELFARLRAEHERGPDPTEVAPPSVAASGPARPAPPEATPEPPSGDEATRRRRDEMLAPLAGAVLRVSKRLLQDEHNELLDAVRRARGRVDATRILPDPEQQRDTWSAVLAPTIDEAYTVGRALTGRGRRPTSAPRRLVAELAAALVTPLRERLIATVDAVVADGPYDAPAELHSALGPAISARYREWRARDLEALLADLLAAAYARGVFDATPSGATLRWVPAEVGQCPDADDNALEPTVKGQCFPTGQPYPPAHPGCRCLVVPSDVGASRPSV